MLPDLNGWELPHDAQRWLKKVKRCVEICEWDHAEAMNIVRKLLVQDARDWLLQLEEDHEITWKMFLEKFKKRFLREHLSPIYRNALRRRYSLNIEKEKKRHTNIEFTYDEVLECRVLNIDIEKITVSLVFLFCAIIFIIMVVAILIKI